MGNKKMMFWEWAAALLGGGSGGGGGKKEALLMGGVGGGKKEALLMGGGGGGGKKETALMGGQRRWRCWAAALLFMLPTTATTNISSRSRVQLWVIRLSTSILVWACLLQLLALGGQLWPHHPLNSHQHRLLPHHWPSSCFFTAEMRPRLLQQLRRPQHTLSSAATIVMPQATLLPSTTTPNRSPCYSSNGYLLVSCNGGLNQMRAAICDMVAVARLLNLTLIVPELDKSSFWKDSSDFGDIFDTKHFINSLRGDVRIIEQLPDKFQSKLRKGLVFSMQPVSWSNESYYLHQILPIVRKRKIIRFSKTDTRVANGGLSHEFQKLRCRVNYGALKFTERIQRSGRKLVESLRSRGPFLVLHLRYEMDMLAFSGCTQGCTTKEVEELTKLRYAYPWWKEKVIDSKQKRAAGLCPLTPEETLLTLKALGYGEDTQIYIAAGEIYGGDKRMAGFYEAFPNVVRKELLLSPEELRHFRNHSSQMAALDYLVAIDSDVFVPTYDGNMAKVVEGHRRYLGYRKTIQLDRRALVGLLDQYQNGSLEWGEFSSAVREAHEDRMGNPASRRVMLDRPKEEDYFYANPHECFL